MKCWWDGDDQKEIWTAALLFYWDDDRLNIRHHMESLTKKIGFYASNISDNWNINFGLPVWKIAIEKHMHALAWVLDDHSLRILFSICK